MFRSLSLGLFFVLLIIQEVSADWCSAGIYRSYYCSPGQSCGTYYGDCRGLPTYMIITIISSCLVLLSIWIRCCVYLSSNNTQRTPARAPLSAQHPGQVRVQVHSVTNNLATRPRTAVPVHNIREDAPPDYAAVVSSTTEQKKY